MAVVNFSLFVVAKFYYRWWNRYVLKTRFHSLRNNTILDATQLGGLR